jgi:beta-galactosidase
VGQGAGEALTPARGRIVLSGLWNFMPSSDAPSAESTWGMIRVPGSWKPFREERGAAMPGVTRSGSGPAWVGVDFNSLGRAWYSRTIQIPEAWRGRAIQLELTRLSTDAIVYANGTECGRIGEGFGAVDISDAVEPGKEATLAIFVMAGVEAREVTQKMGVGVGHETKIKVTLPMAGINGDAVLHSRPQGAHVSDVFVKPSTRQKKLTLDIELASVRQAGPVGVTAELLDEKGKVEKTFTGNVHAKAAGCSASRLPSTGTTHGCGISTSRTCTRCAWA